MTTPARLAIVGDYDPTMYTHLAIDTALAHVREQREHALEWRWVATSALTNDVAARLAVIDADWIAAGSHYVSMDGALAAFRQARESNLPLLGVCGVFQHVVLAYARDVVGLTFPEHG